MQQTLLVFSLVHVCLCSINQWDLFATKTTYTWSHGNEDPEVDEIYTINEGSGVCRAVQVNMLRRHGARYPSHEKTQEIAELYTRLIQSSVELDMEDVNTYGRLEAGQLAVAGQEEQHGLGRRTGLRFQSLLKNNGQYITFMSSSRERAVDSSLNFYEGLKSTVEGLESFDNDVNDSLIRFYDGCENYETQVEENEALFVEYANFEKTFEFIYVKEKLERKLNNTFTRADVYLIYEMCSYDKYILNKTSFWCFLLSDEDRLVLEYGSDIENYYQKSYGHPINSAMACPLLGDMFRTMDKAISYTWDYQNLPTEALHHGYLAGKFMIGHSTTLINLFSTLGLYKDEQPLLATNMEDMVDRHFRTSNIAPYSANLAFVLYACDDNLTLANTDRSFMVQLLVNEEPVLIPGCDSTLCPYSEIRERYHSIVEECNIVDICFSDAMPSAGKLSLIVYIVVIIAFLIV